MKFFKSHTGAMVVMTVVIILSVLLGSHRSLTAERAKVEALFTQGDGSGYSIATDLADRRDIGANLLTVAGRYLSENDTADLAAAVRELGQAEDLGELYLWNEALGEHAEEVMAKLDGCALSEKDAQYVQGFRTDLAARADTIARDPYNQQAENFNEKVLGAFPANLLSRITFVRKAQVFG